MTDALIIPLRPAYDVLQAGRPEPSWQHNILAMQCELTKKELLGQARGTINSFANDQDVHSAIENVCSGTIFSSKLVPDTSPNSQSARYDLTVAPQDGSADEVMVYISPNALDVGEAVLKAILDLPKETPLEPKALALCYKGIYALAVTRYVVMRHLHFSQDISSGISEELEFRVNELHNETFPSNELIEDTTVQLERISLAMGGAVMMRTVANDVRSLGEVEGDYSAISLGNFLRIFGMGLAQHAPAESKEVSFGLAHALPPSKMSYVMRYWFGRNRRV